MAKFPLYQWKKAGGGSSSIDTSNFASKIKANTFTQKNVFKNTGDVLTIQRTDDQSFGIDFKNEADQRLAYIGTSQNEAGKATVWGINGLKLQTTNNLIELNSGTADCKWESNRNWNQHSDRTIVRAQDLKWNRFFEYTTGVRQPGTTWNVNDWTWTVNNLTSQNGFYQFMIIVSIGNVAYSLNGTVVWKNGLTESKSQFITISDGANTYDFQLVIKQNNNFRIYHKKSGGSNNIDWVRGWILRGNNYPWKTNNLW